MARVQLLQQDRALLAQHYMHDGTFATLADVLDYYDRSGNANPSLDPELRPLHLAPGEKQALVAFLQTLSGTVREGP